MGWMDQPVEAHLTPRHSTLILWPATHPPSHSSDCCCIHLNVGVGALLQALDPTEAHWAARSVVAGMKFLFAQLRTLQRDVANTHLRALGPLVRTFLGSSQSIQQPVCSRTTNSRWLTFLPHTLTLLVGVVGFESGCKRRWG